MWEANLNGKETEPEQHRNWNGTKQDLTGILDTCASSVYCIYSDCGSMDYGVVNLLKVHNVFSRPITKKNVQIHTTAGSPETLKYSAISSKSILECNV